MQVWGPPHTFLPHCMTRSDIRPSKNTRQANKLPTWKHFVNKYLTTHPTMVAAPAVTSEQLTRKPSILRTMFSKRTSPTSPSGYIGNTLNVGPPTGFRHEGSFFYATDAYNPTVRPFFMLILSFTDWGFQSFTPAHIAPAYPSPRATTLKKSSSVKVPKKTSQPIHARSNSISGTDHQIFFTATGSQRRHMNSGPAVPPKEDAVLVKKVRWADAHNDSGESENQARADATHPPLSRKPRLTAYPSVDQPSVDQENRPPWHQQGYDQSSHSRSQQPRYTIPPQSRKPVPYHLMPAPVVLADYPLTASSPAQRQSSRRSSGMPKGGRMTAAELEAFAECTRLELSIADKRQRNAYSDRRY